MTGFVPHNMVSEVQVDDEDLMDRTVSSLADTHTDNIPDHKYQPNDVHNSQYPQVVIQEPSDSGYHQERPDNYQPEQDMDYMPEQDDEQIAYEDPRKSMNYSLKPKKMVALFDYDPQILSPNPDSEVSTDK